MSKTKRVPVLVTTEFRGVFFGYANPDKLSDENLTLRGCRCAIYWAGDRGFLGLASHGPHKDSRIGSTAKKVRLRKVTSVTDVSSEAEKVWTEWPEGE